MKIYRYDYDLKLGSNKRAIFNLGGFNYSVSH